MKNSFFWLELLIAPVLLAHSSQEGTYPTRDSPIDLGAEDGPPPPNDLLSVFDDNKKSLVHDTKHKDVDSALLLLINNKQEQEPPKVVSKNSHDEPFKDEALPAPNLMSVNKQEQEHPTVVSNSDDEPWKEEPPPPDLRSASDDKKEDVDYALSLLISNKKMQANNGALRGNQKFDEMMLSAKEASAIPKHLDKPPNELTVEERAEAWLFLGSSVEQQMAKLNGYADGIINQEEEHKGVPNEIGSLIKSFIEKGKSFSKALPSAHRYLKELIPDDGSPRTDDDDDNHSSSPSKASVESKEEKQVAAPNTNTLY